MLKKINKVLSLTLIFSLISGIAAQAAVDPETASVNKIEEAIVAQTSISDIVTDTYSNSKYEAVMDGTDVTVKVPNSNIKPITIDDAYDDADSLSISMPKSLTSSTDVVTADDGTIVYYKKNSPASLAVQPTNDGVLEGVRSLITINNSSAPKEYSFTFNLDANSRLVTASEYLGKEYDTKEVYVVNQDNIITSVIEAPWAVDADGNAIDTYYKVNGNKITQVINFNENTKFPVVADPSWKKIAKCSASVAWAIGSGLFAAAKLIKLKKYIAALGGLTEAVTLMLKCSTTQERLQAGGTALVNFSSIIFGVDAIKDNCLS